MSRVYRDPRYADELAGKPPPKRTLPRRSASHGGGLILGSGGGASTDDDRNDDRQPGPEMRGQPGRGQPGRASRQRPANPDPRGVLRAVNEYETMLVLGGWWQMTGEHPDIATIARIQLVMAGKGDAERRLQEEAEDEMKRHSGSSDGPPSGARGERRETVSVARSEYVKKTPVYQGPPARQAG